MRRMSVGLLKKPSKTLNAKTTAKTPCQMLQFPVAATAVKGEIACAAA